jgi:hypothetical protein
MGTELVGEGVGAGVGVGVAAGVGDTLARDVIDVLLAPQAQSTAPVVSATAATRRTVLNGRGSGTSLPVGAGPVDHRQLVGDPVGFAIVMHRLPALLDRTVVVDDDVPADRQLGIEGLERFHR